MEAYCHLSPTISADLSISVLVPFSAYKEPMLDAESMKAVAQITDKQKPDKVFMAKDDVVLADPPISLTVSTSCIKNRRSRLVFRHFWHVFLLLAK